MQAQPNSHLAHEALLRLANTRVPSRPVCLQTHTWAGVTTTHARHVLSHLAHVAQPHAAGVVLLLHAVAHGVHHAAAQVALQLEVGQRLLVLQGKVHIRRSWHAQYGSDIVGDGRERMQLMEGANAIAIDQETEDVRSA